MSNNKPWIRYIPKCYEGIILLEHESLLKHPHEHRSSSLPRYSGAGYILRTLVVEVFEGFTKGKCIEFGAAIGSHRHNHANWCTKDKNRKLKYKQHYLKQVRRLIPLGFHFCAKVLLMDGRIVWVRRWFRQNPIYQKNYNLWEQMK